VAPHRRHIRDAIVRVRKPLPGGGKADPKQLHCYLFNDLFATAKLFFKKQIEELSRLIPLISIWIIANPDDEPGYIGTSRSLSGCQEIVESIHHRSIGVDTTSFLLVSLEVSYIVYTKTPGEKDAWVTDISHAIENLQKINRSYAGIVVCYSCVCVSNELQGFLTSSWCRSCREQNNEHNIYRFE